MRRRERLGEKDAVGDALGGPIFGGLAGHVDDRHIGLVLSRMPGYGPAIHFVLYEIDVGDKRPAYRICGVQQFDNRMQQRGGNSAIMKRTMASAWV